MSVPPRTEEMEDYRRRQRAGSAKPFPKGGLRWPEEWVPAARLWVDPWGWIHWIVPKPEAE